MNTLNKPLAIAAGAAIVASLFATPSSADTNPFQLAELDSGYMLAERGTEAKCGEAKCGEDKAAAQAMPSPAEAKCGANKDEARPAPEAKCGASK